MCIDGGRSGVDPEDQAARRRAVLRAGRIPRRRARTGSADGDDREGARRPGAVAARRCVAQTRWEGVRVRARAAVRPLPTNRLAPPQGVAPGGHCRLGARGAMGLLLRDPRRAEGAVRVAELSDIRETVRRRYADAANAAGAGSYEGARVLETEAGCCGPGALSCSPADQTAVFGVALYDEKIREEAPGGAINASL